jgi:imidazolonepropionase
MTWAELAWSRMAPLLVGDGSIVAVGTAPICALLTDEPTLDAAGCVVMPGFVDPHTHLMWAGDRAAGRLRLRGRLIWRSGSRRRRSVHRACHPEASLNPCWRDSPATAAMLAHGTTTAEAKTGYGLETGAG